MSKVDTLVIGGKIRAQKAFEKLTCKKPGDAQIVVALVLIAVAVGLCILFRNNIKTIMGNLITTITEAITDLANGAIE